MNTHFFNKRFAHILGLAGLVPFVVMLLGCWLVPLEWLGDFIRGQLAYGIIILSFLGGVHWGATLNSATLSAAQTKQAFLWGVIPSLLAWSATMVGGFGFAILIAGFILAYQVDKRLTLWYGFPEWFIQLRYMLTCTVVVALAMTVVAANVRG